MISARMRSGAAFSGAFLMLALAWTGCGHKQPPPAPPAPPPAAPAPSATPAPTVELHASPTDITRGAQSTLSWNSSNAVRVTLNGSPVNLNGTDIVTPPQSTDYQMVATNADGRTAQSSVRVTVSSPAEQPPPPPPPAVALSTLFTENVRDAFFDFDKYTIRTDAEQNLMQDAQFLKAHPEVQVLIEGHCDDRGSAQYNLALGDRRANAVKDFLIQQGVDTGRIRTVSYGKERPYCSDDTEDCWQQNRRGAVTNGSAQPQ